MIRDYTSQDTDALELIWRSASNIAHPFLTNSFLESEADNLRNIYLKHASTRVFEHDGQPVGFIAMIDDEIGGLFLMPDQHGKGFGRSLVEDVARSYDNLRVAVFERNQLGRRFYKSIGFQEVARSVHEKTGETVLHLTMSNTTAATSAASTKQRECLS